MKGFEPVTLEWNGEKFTVPADQQMMLIAVVEDALAGPAGEQPLTVLMRKEGPPYSRLAAAYGGALRHAGADVSDADIYLSIMEGFTEGGDTTLRIQGAIMGLLAIIAPPFARAVRGDGAGKKPEGAADPAS